jgi:hypothetical protein
MAAQAQHAGNFAGAPLDDFDDEMLRLLGGVGEGLLAPETQLLGAGLAVGSSLKEEWMGGTTAVRRGRGRAAERQRCVCARWRLVATWAGRV